MARVRLKSLIAGTVFAVMVVVGVGLTARWTPPPAKPPAAGEAQISTGALEARYGIKLTRIAVTAAGGLVELRFTVVDSAKAKLLLGDRTTAPSLIAEESGHTLQAPRQGAWRNIRLQQDAACFVLFPNARSAVKPGTKVSLAFGGLRVESVVAM